MLCDVGKRTLALMCLLLVGCTSVVVSNGEPAEDRGTSEPSSAADSTKSPFESAPASEADIGGLYSCLSAKLALVEREGEEQPGASLELSNKCVEALAVLVSPVEVRTMLEPSDVFHWEGMRGPFAVLYVYRRDFGEPRLYGDWGKTVRGEPGYAVVPSSGGLSIPIDGLDSLKLPHGEYASFLHTWAVPTTLESGTSAVMALRESVSEHNEKNKEKPEAAKALNFIEIATLPSEFSVKPRKLGQFR